MNVEANDLLLFSRVVDEGSFSRAAERLRMPKSTLSRRITALEEKLGERLILRTTRKLTITDFGRAVVAHAHQVTAEVEATVALTRHHQTEPRGRLRISIPGDFDILHPVLVEFALRYPDISLEIDLSPRRVDLIGENFDLAIRMGDLPEDNSLGARRIATFKAGLYASPAYLEQRGIPQEPEALAKHAGLQLLKRRSEPIIWQLRREQSQWQGMPKARISANSPHILILMAASGLGIAMLSEDMAMPHIQSGTLVQILTDWQLPAISAWAVFPKGQLMPARTRIFLDTLMAVFPKHTEKI